MTKSLTCLYKGTNPGLHRWQASILTTACQKFMVILCSTISITQASQLITCCLVSILILYFFVGEKIEYLHTDCLATSFGRRSNLQVVHRCEPCSGWTFFFWHFFSTTLAPECGFDLWQNIDMHVPPLSICHWSENSRTEQDRTRTEMAKYVTVLIYDTLCWLPSLPSCQGSWLASRSWIQAPLWVNNVSELWDTNSKY